MIRVLLDQGLPRSTATELRMAGWDALHVGELDMSQAEDTVLLAFAAHEARIIITLDADFHALLAVGALAKPSVVRVRIEGLQGMAMAKLLLHVWPNIHQALIMGAVVTVTEQRIRIRSLPIR